MNRYCDYVIGTLVLVIVILLFSLAFGDDCSGTKAPAQIQYEACVKTAEDLGLNADMKVACWTGAFNLR